MKSPVYSTVTASPVPCTCASQPRSVTADASSSPRCASAGSKVHPTEPVCGTSYPQPSSPCKSRLSPVLARILRPEHVEQLGRLVRRHLRVRISHVHRNLHVTLSVEGELYLRRGIAAAGGKCEGHVRKCRMLTALLSHRS